MKNLYIFILLFFTFFSNAQTGITYQAVILNPKGEELPGVDNNRSPLANETVCLRFKIYNNANQLEYQETMVTTTDEFGMVNVIIGIGTYTGGTATSIGAVTWDGTPKNLVVEVDTTGMCTNFIQISNQPFTYVPYAFYAVNSGTPGTPGPIGATGAQGLQGPSGINGTNGVNGIDGKNTLINTTIEPPGANCTSGGVKMKYGLDINSNGTLDSNEINNSLTKYVCNGANASTTGIFSHYIGELYGGGIIVALWGNNGVEHGLIASLADLGTAISQTSVPLNNGAFSWYDGMANTLEFIANDPASQHPAKICRDYNGGGFNDWYLPAMDELKLILHVKAIVNYILPLSGKLHSIGGSDNSSSICYWSSTINQSISFNDYTGCGPSTVFGKNIRAVRKF